MKMPLARSKCRAVHHQMIGTGQRSPLPLATLCLLGAILFDQIGMSSALQCYQGQMSLQMPISGSPVQCPTQAYTCIKSVDYSQGVVTRACQSTNCTIMGTYQTTYSSQCYNSTGYPPQTFCCCYGDGCNSALGTTSMGVLFVALIGAATALALKNLGPI